MTDKNEFEAPLYATVELSGAMELNLGNVGFSNNSNIEVQTVQNTDKQVALVLPFYSAMDSVPSSQVLADEDLDDASGGFFGSMMNTEQFLNLRLTMAQNSLNQTRNMSSREIKEMNWLSLDLLGRSYNHEESIAHFEGQVASLTAKLAEF